jgi:hypothetical protein
LFRAAICNVGCANTMNEFTPNGPVNTGIQVLKMKRALLRMDGVAHVQKARILGADGSRWLE